MRERLQVARWNHAAATEDGTRAPRSPDDAAIAAIQIAHAQGRSAEARDLYGDIVRRHQRRALRIARRLLSDDAEADDVVQDAFVKAYAHLPTFRPTLAFQPWFTRILVNCCLDRLRARRRHNRWFASVPEPSPGHRDFFDALPSSVASPEDQVLARERRATVVRALESLPARQRSVVVLSHYDGLTSSEVSALTGWNASTVRVHLFRGLRTLRAALAGGRP